MLAISWVCNPTVFLFLWWAQFTQHKVPLCQFIADDRICFFSKANSPCVNSLNPFIHSVIDENWSVGVFFFFFRYKIFLHFQFLLCWICNSLSIILGQWFPTLSILQNLLEGSQSTNCWSFSPVFLIQQPPLGFWSGQIQQDHRGCCCFC